MNKSFEHLLEAIAGFLTRLAQDLHKYVENLRKPKKLITSDEAGQDTSSIAEGMVPLEIDRPVIQVECISCGEVGELTGICQKCHGAICLECKQSIHDGQLDMHVIQCRDCAATVQT